MSVPQHFYDENPSTPYTMYNDVNFDTQPGTFYMEYVARDGTGWWMDYSITVDPGGLFFSSGDDFWF